MTPYVARDRWHRSSLRLARAHTIVQFASLARTLIRPLARSLAPSLFRNRLTPNSPPKQPNKKQPPNFLSPLGRLMYIYIYIYTYIHTYIYKHKTIYTWYVCLYACMYECTYVRMYVQGPVKEIERGAAADTSRFGLDITDPNRGSRNLPVGPPARRKRTSCARAPSRGRPGGRRRVCGGGGSPLAWPKGLGGRRGAGVSHLKSFHHHHHHHHHYYMDCCR